MIILHGAWSDGFFVWGEHSFTKIGLHNLRRLRRVGDDCPIDHIWGMSAKQLSEALAGLGFNREPDPQATKAELFLPTYAQKYPVPSSPLLGEIPMMRISKSRQRIYDMRKWFVERLPLGIPDLMRLTPVCRGDAPLTDSGILAVPGLMMGLDFCYIAECYRWAVSLLERGRFLPDIRKRGEGKYEPVWRPLLMGEDAEYFSCLIKAMPPVLRSFRANRALSEGELLYEIQTYLVDGLVRYSWTQKIRKNVEDESDTPHRKLVRSIASNSRFVSPQSAERRKKGKLVSSLNPHTLWVRSLGWSGEADNWSAALGEIYRDVRGWWSKFEWFARSPYKVCLELLERNGVWRIEYALRHVEQGYTIPAEDVWREAESYPGGASGAYLRRYLLVSLGQIARLIEPVRESLDLFAPCGCSLTLEQAAEYLEEQAPMLMNRGVCVIFPDWWRERIDRKITLRGRVTAEGRGGDEPLPMTWELSMNGLPLTDEEANMILEGGSSLFKLRGEWVFIHPDEAEEVRERLRKAPAEMSTKEALRFAVCHPYVEGFVGAPELEDTHTSLVRGIPGNILTAPSSLLGALRQYQLRGYSWLTLLSRLGLGACLADDMGLGKTVQTLAMIQHHRDLGEKRPVLLVCPTSVLENWRLEMLRFFPGMTSYLHHGRKRAHDEDFKDAIQGKAMVLSSYSILQREAYLYQKINWAGIVLDEAQNIKNPDTLQARAARGVKSDWRVVLTGTPVENHVGDLWSIMEFLMPGLLGNRRFFMNEYVRPIQENRDLSVMDTLKRRVSPFIMRRMKTDREIVPDLPRKIETKVFCGLKKEQAKLYSDVSGELSRNISGATGIKRKGMVLAALTRIKQICDHPALVTKDTDFGWERSAKMERLLALAEEMYETGDRTLIFTQYVEMGNILKSQLQERFGREALFLHGGVNKGMRDDMVRRFQESEGSQFFILSLKAGGVGLNLTNANRVVLYDRWWNPAVEQQAIDRAYRIGQARNVQVHVFCCKGTLEERIDELIASKMEVANKVIEASDNWVAELSDEGLRDLLSLSPGALES